MSLKSVLYNRKPGDVIRVRYLRGNNENTYIVALAIQGKRFPSEGFADFINQLGIKGRSSITRISRCG